MNLNEIPHNIFRANDIRGIAHLYLSDTTIATIAVAYGEFLKEKKINSIGLGHDVRLSSPRIYSVFKNWIGKTGITVYCLGQVPSPVAYFAAYTKSEIDALAIITASHNPAEYNGIKLNYLKKSLSQKEIMDLYARAKTIDLDYYNDIVPTKTKKLSVIDQYIDYLASQFRFQKKFNIVVDPANATGGIISKPLYEKLGFDFKIINKKIDGSFPNHEPDPTVAKNLKKLAKKVIARQADCGIGYDGDSDRIGVVDDLGRFIAGDILMALFAKDILNNNKGASIVIEVKSSQMLIDTIQEAGGIVQMSKVGHGFIKHKIAETGALLAGELSGHMFFCDRYFGFDDAFYCSLRLLELLERTGKKLSQLIDAFPKYCTTPEILLQCDSDEEKFARFQILEQEFKKFENTDLTDGVRIQFKHGWGLVRPSNTQPAIVTRYEADTNEHLSEIQKQIESIINKHYLGTKKLSF